MRTFANRLRFKNPIFVRQGALHKWTKTTHHPLFHSKMCITSEMIAFKSIEMTDESMALLLSSVGPPEPLFAQSLSQDSEDSDASYKPSPPPSPEPVRRVSSRRNSSQRPKHPHIVTKHNYHDHAADPLDAALVDAKHEKNGHMLHHHSMIPFPLKLYDMLERVEAEGCHDVVSWQSHGRCFVVHNVAQFKEILPNYFKLSKIASFQRQLNLYGFQR